MRSTLRPLLVIALFAAQFSGAAMADKSSDASYHRMKMAQIIDRVGFEKPLPAFSMLIPTEWNIESQVSYPKGGAGCGNEMYKVGFRASSPDGRYAIELIPAWFWQWSDAPQMRDQMNAKNQQNARFGTPPCEIFQPMNAASFVKNLAPKVRPGAKLLNVEPIPDADAAVQQGVQAAQAQANQFGTHARFSADHARAHIAYDLKGKPVEEWLTAVVTVRAMPSPIFANGRMMQTANYSISARRLFALRAPAGELEANRKLFQSMIASIMMEPEWGGRVGQVQQNIAAIQAKGESDRQAIRAKSFQDTQRIRQQGIQHQQEVQDESHQRFDQYLRGVQTYRDPDSGQKVELSNQYNHAWSNGSGEYILSDSPNFNPNAALQGNWTQLNQVDH